MSNDSSTGGYLQPAPSPAPAPLEDAALRDFLQAVFVGLTGLDGKLVRPRWQPVPPAQPEIGTNWMAFGIVARPADTFAFEMHDPAAANGNGADVMNRNEELTILCSFYGPNAGGYATGVRDGLSVPQNREALLKAGMALIGCEDIVSAPALINDQWYSRLDMTVRIRRSVTRVYPILHITSAGITLTTDTGIVENIIVEP